MTLIFYRGKPQVYICAFAWAML